MRKNGWKMPFHALQLVTWVVFPVIMALFFAFYTPVLEETASIVASIVYALACVVTTVSVVICTGTDPADDCVLRPSTNGRGDDQVYCNVCMKYVHNESRHCRLCDKCVAVFDHHCKWLNNCVGQKNYRYFLGSVIGATVFLAIQIAVGIFVLVSCYTSSDTMSKRLASSFGCSSGVDENTDLCSDDDYHVSLNALRVIHIVMLAFLVPWLFMIGQLTMFHFQLCYEGITTYDYIVQQRKRKMARDRENASNSRGPRASLLARLCGCCSGKKAGPENNTKPSDNNTHSVSRNSERSIQSEEEEQAAIEADVDDDLEVLSSQSGEIRERESSRRGRPSNDGPRGFSLHVKLGFSRPSHEELHTPSEPSYTPASTGGSSAQYLAAPHTPGTPQTPRSDAGSAYFSNSGDEHDEHASNQPLPGYLLSSDSSMVMYGRPPTRASENHIV